MIAISIGAFILTASALGSYGRKASLRIRTWGEKMNEQDAIFRSVASPEELADMVSGERSAPASVGKHPIPIRLPH